MKKITVLVICILLPLGISAQSLTGAWDSFHTLENGDQIKSVAIFSDGYHVISAFDAKTGKFISTTGGTLKYDGDTMTQKVEFHSDDTDRVGKEISVKVTLTDSILDIVGQMKLKRIDAGAPGKLQGAWLMSGRIRDGKTQLRDTSRPRKTMKILSGTRFQWIAYNTETKQFMGTGGGTYTTIDGEYTESIEFFSRDDTKAGKRLKFDFSLVDGKWSHKGLSSKGDPIHEIWSVRE